MSIVVAYSPDEHGMAAVEYGVAEAELRNERLFVVNASTGDAYVDPHWAHEEAVSELRQRLTEIGVEHEVRQVVAPDVSDAVLAVVDEVDASLLVVAMRRRTPVGKLLMGSISQRLVLGARCPVLAVKVGAEPSRRR